MGLSLSLAVFSQVTQFMPLSPALLSISPTYPLAGRFSRLHSHIIYFMGKTIFLWTGQSQCAEIVKQKERSVSGRRVIAQNPKSNALINQQKVINPASSSFSPFKPIHISYYDFNRLVLGIMLVIDLPYAKDILFGISYVCSVCTIFGIIYSLQASYNN